MKLKAPQLIKDDKVDWFQILFDALIEAGFDNIYLRNQHTTLDITIGDRSLSIHRNGKWDVI